MPLPLVYEFEGVTDVGYAAVSRHLGIDPETGEGDWPPGMFWRAAGTADDGTFMVWEVWSSREDQAAWDLRLAPAGAADGDCCGSAGRLGGADRRPSSLSPMVAARAVEAARRSWPPAGVGLTYAGLHRLKGAGRPGRVVQPLAGGLPAAWCCGRRATRRC